MASRLLHTRTRLAAALWLYGLLLAAAVPASAQDLATFINWGAEWNYRDVGTDPGPSWHLPEYSGGGWSRGAAELGYGDGDEQTKVSYGPDPQARFVTSYYRHAFEVPDANAVQGLHLRLLSDDGAIVYLNGTEVVRTNMPEDPVTYETLSESRLTGITEAIRRKFRISPTLLTTGRNVLAVEVHQAQLDDGDLSFDAELVQTGPGTVLRDPFVQSVSSDRAVVRWDAGAPGIGIVRFGTDPGNLSRTALEATSAVRHAVALSGLQPGTRYYYAISVGGEEPPAQTEVRTFRTAPATGSAAMTRIWVLGDSGYTTAGVLNVRDAYRVFAGRRPADLWLMLGDNAYPDGTDDQYQAAVFETFPEELASIALWPTIGNHDGRASNPATQTGPYFDIFALPTGAEAGGVPSNTEAYYSFDYANIHFISLDSEGSDRSADGPMLTWLRNDLARTDSDWIIAFWHDAPFSRGSHNSDSESRMTQMRENAVPILEEAGVDLVLAGHSHAYERSFLLDGHYGRSDTFTEEMKVLPGLGRLEEDGPYLKPTAGRSPHEGAVYVVSGSASAMSAQTMDHPAISVAHRSLGSVIVDVNGNRLDAVFLDGAGQALDRFTIVKGADWRFPDTVGDAAQALNRAIGLTPATAEDLARWNVDTRDASWDRIDMMDVVRILQAAG